MQGGAPHHLLGQEHLLSREVDAKVSTGENDTVGSIDDLLKRHQPVPVLNLCNHPRGVKSQPV
jgi:hypothetical protein